MNSLSIVMYRTFSLPFFILTFIFLGGCESAENNTIISENLNNRIVNVSVYYISKGKETPDSFSKVYVYFNRKYDDFIDHEYSNMKSGIFSDSVKSIVPNKSLIVNEIGRGTIHLSDDEAKKDFFIIVQSKKTQLYTLTFFDIHEYGTSLKVIFN